MTAEPLAQEPSGDADGAGRRGVRVVALSIAIPAVLLAYAIRVHNKLGLTWVTALGLLVALSVVTVAVVYGSRR